MLWNYLCMAGQPNGSPHISACIVRALYLFHTHTHTHRVHVSICWLWLSLRENLVRQCRRSFEPEINDKRNENQICAKEIEICIRWVKRSVCVCRRLLIAFGISYWEKNCSMVCVCIEWVSSYELPLYVFVFTVHIDRPNEKNEKKKMRAHTPMHNTRYEYSKIQSYNTHAYSSSNGFWGTATHRASRIHA